MDQKKPDKSRDYVNEFSTYITEHPEAKKTVVKAIRSVLSGVLIPLYEVIIRVNNTLYGDAALSGLHMNYAEQRKALSVWIPKHVVTSRANILFGLPYKAKNALDPTEQ